MGAGLIMPNQRTFQAQSPTDRITSGDETSQPTRIVAPHAGFKYLKSRDFPIHLMCYWWIFWLSISSSNFSEFIAPSLVTVAEFLLLISSFLIGHLTIKFFNRKTLKKKYPERDQFLTYSTSLKLIFYGSATSCFILSMISLWLAGALELNFAEYFFKLRGSDNLESELTGFHYLDVLTKILIFPLSYAIVMIIMGNGLRSFGLAGLICLLNLLLYVYLWQVNYPLIYLFWIFIFYALTQDGRISKSNRIIYISSLIFAFLLITSAFNRFGASFFGALQHYVINYHVAGFAFYDANNNNSHSILHSISYGRSSLGFVDQIFEHISKIFNIEYKSASFENSDFTNEAVDIGINETKYVNAFGTIVFTFHRDFHFIGTIIGGFLYGAAVTICRYLSTGDWIYRSLFLLLASAWMVGMMVSPLEQSYFWLTIIIFIFVRIINKRIKL